MHMRQEDCRSVRRQSIEEAALTCFNIFKLENLQNPNPRQTQNPNPSMLGHTLWVLCFLRYSLPECVPVYFVAEELGQLEFL